jgi:hypothetical protein
MSKKKQTTKKNSSKIPKLKVTILEKGEKVPPNTWQGHDENGIVRYTDFYYLVNQTATIYDNAAIREGRAFSPQTIESVRQFLIEVGREIVPNHGSLSWYLNTIRLRELKKSKGSNELGYQCSESHTQTRLRVTNVVAKKK